MRRITVDESEDDAAFLKTYAEDVDNLCGLVIEMFGDKQATLLSPVFRTMILEHAQRTQWKHRKFADRLHVDNPGRPLDPSVAANVEAFPGPPKPTPAVDLKSSASALAKLFQDDRRVISVAVRAASIAIFVDHTKQPRFVFEGGTFRGWPVEIVDHGPMAVMGGDPNA